MKKNKLKYHPLSGIIYSALVIIFTILAVLIFDNGHFNDPFFVWQLFFYFIIIFVCHWASNKIIPKFYAFHTIILFGLSLYFFISNLFIPKSWDLLICLLFFFIITFMLQLSATTTENNVAPWEFWFVYVSYVILFITKFQLLLSPNVFNWKILIFIFILGIFTLWLKLMNNKLNSININPKRIKLFRYRLIIFFKNLANKQFWKSNLFLYILAGIDIIGFIIFLLIKNSQSAFYWIVAIITLILGNFLFWRGFFTSLKELNNQNKSKLKKEWIKQIILSVMIVPIGGYFAKLLSQVLTNTSNTSTIIEFNCYLLYVAFFIFILILPNPKNKIKSKFKIKE